MPLSSFLAADGTPNKRAIVECAAFNACIYKNAIQSAQDILDLTGGGSINAGAFQPDAFSPSWGLGRDSEGTVYIVFAGTTNLRQMHAHLAGAAGVNYVEWDRETGVIHLDVQCHPWWQLAWTTVGPDVIEALRGVTPFVNIRVTGHSYGGAVALLCAFHLARNFPSVKIELMTFAQPIVMSKGYSGALPESIVRVVTENDLVPSLGPQVPFYMVPLGFLSKLVAKQFAPFGHFGQRVKLNQDGSTSIDNGQEKLWFTRPGALTDTLAGDAHFMSHYCSCIQKMWDKRGLSQPVSTIASIGRTVSNGLIVPESRVVHHTQYQSLAQQANSFLPDGSDPTAFNGVDNRRYSSISIADLGYSTDSKSVPTGDASSPFLHTISNSGESMALSGKFKLTLIINNGKNGTSTSVVWNGSGQTMEDAIAIGKSLALKRSYLLGNATGTVDPAKARDTPVIEFLRVSDALNPRVSQLVEITGNARRGPTGSETPADVLSTALTVRISGISQGVAPRSSISNHQIVGQPDAVVKRAAYDGSTPMTEGFTTFDAAMKSFLDYLTLSGNKFGFMGQDTTETVHSANTFTFNDLGKYQLVVTAHGYTSRDRIRITAANAKGFNGVHLIQVVDSNTLYLHTSLKEGLALPTTARVQRVQMADGTRKVEFYQFVRPAAGWVSPFGIKVSKKNLGREITGVSFRKRTRK